MEGVTGTMTWLSHVPGYSRSGLYGPANTGFRCVTATVATSLSFGVAWGRGAVGRGAVGSTTE